MQMVKHSLKKYPVRNKSFKPAFTGLSKFYVPEFLVFFVIAIITLLFFYPVLKGFIPFPGDLLVGHYAPYNTSSYSGYGPGAVPHKAQGPDVIRELFPWKHFIIESLKDFRVPYWNPYNFSGNPLMANFQSGTFYPLNFIYFIFQFNLGWTIFIYLIPLLSAWFMYLYMREIEAGRMPALFSGLVFAFSGYMVVWMEYGNIGHTMLWLPLALYLTEKLTRKFSPGILFSLITILAASLLAGYIQGYFYIVLVLGFYFTGKKIIRREFSLKQILIFVVCLGYPFLLTLFQLLPMFNLFKQSSRGNYSLETITNLLNPLWYAITVVAPDYFGHPASRNHWFYGTYIERVSYFGLIPFVFALHALLNLRRKKEAYLFASIFIISFILAFDFFFTRYFYRIPIPVISTTVPTRLLSLFCFSGAILAGLGLDLFQKERKTRRLFISLGITFVIILSGGIIAIIFKSGPDLGAASNYVISLRNLVLPSLFTAAVLFLGGVAVVSKKAGKFLPIFILLLTLADLFRFFHKITPFSPVSYVYPETPVITYLQKTASINRYWGYGSGHVDTNFQTYDHTYSPEGNDPLHVKAYTEFLETTNTGRIPEALPRPDAVVAPGYGEQYLRENYFRQKALNILGVKYVLHKYDNAGEEPTPDTNTFDPLKYRLVWQKTPWQVYENLQAAPRVFLTADYLVISEKEKIIHAFYSRKFNEKTSLILDDDPDLRRQQLNIREARVIKYNPDEVDVRTKSDKEALLFISDTFYPEWRATVDGKVAKIFRADYAFRAVKVPAGEHKVRFSYEDKAFKYGLVISVVSLSLLVVLLLSPVRKKIIRV